QPRLVPLRSAGGLCRRGDSSSGCRGARRWVTPSHRNGAKGAQEDLHDSRGENAAHSAHSGWARPSAARPEDVPICQSQGWSISLAIALSWEEIAMKLYMHPVSMTSRPVRLFIAENKIPVEEVTVDLFTGEHYGPAYTAVNPNNLVPMIED